MDRSLREAERSGDDGALLRERIRAGELSSDLVEFAARLGRGDAKALYPGTVILPGIHVALRKAVSLLGETTLPARVAADWAERALGRWEELNPDDRRPREAIAAARAWADCPCAEHAALGGEASIAAWRAAVDARNAADGDGAAVAASHAAAAANAFRSNERSFAAAAPSAFASANVARATEQAAHAAFAVAADAENLSAENEWQHLRLAAYVLGDV